jgi:hypothetical protein
VVIIVSSYLEVDSFTLLSINRFSVLYRIKCLKSPECDIDLKFLECKVMLTSWMPVHCYGVFPRYYWASYSFHFNDTANVFPSPPTPTSRLPPLCYGVFPSSDKSPSRFHVGWLPSGYRIKKLNIEATLIKRYPYQNVKKLCVATDTHTLFVNLLIIAQPTYWDIMFSQKS